VTLANPRASLWKTALADGSVETTVAERIALPSGGGRSPRLGPDYLLYVVTRGDQDHLWKLENGSALELWSAPKTRIVGGAAIAPDGGSVAFTLEREGRHALMLMAADGTHARELAATLDVHGSPDWAPDGRSITVAARIDGAPRLFKVALDGSPPAPLVTGYSTDPSWSPDGRFVVYSGAEVGPTFAVDAATATGQPFPLPDLTLPRGARRLRVLPDGGTLLALGGGGVGSGDFVAIDLLSGEHRKVTNFGHEFTVGDFDVSADGREIVFDRVAENSDIVLIER
jgi:dipeptidyl aminopeptidase/acylaminoacyl peptidase